MLPPRRISAGLPPVVALAAALFVLGHSGDAQARRNGYFGNCAQCHKDAQGVSVALTLTPDQWEPGALVHVSVQVMGPGNSAGFYLSSSGVGELIPSNGDSRSQGTQATHTNPKSMGGSTTFELDWQAPSEPRAVHFTAYGVAANGNNNASGDGTGGPVLLDRIFGCEGETFYRDFDGDGYGTDLVPPVVDCVAPVGYAPNGGDCSEDDATLNPGMPEICNGIDDDCDNRIDEFAAPTCGVGLCLRYAEFCDATAPCFPGEPFPEACNGLDDDCDGVVDQGDLCAGDLVCQAAECKTLDEALALDPNFMPFEGSEEPVGSGGSAGTGGMSSVTPMAGAGGASVTPSAGATGAAGSSAGLAGSTTGPSSAATSDSGGGCALPQGEARGKGTVVALLALTALLTLRTRRRR